MVSIKMIVNSQVELARTTKMKFYCYKRLNRKSRPFAIVSTNGIQDDYVLGITSNMVLVIVNKDNELVLDFKAPEELRPLAKKVREFMKNPLYEIQTCLYFRKQGTCSDEDL